MKNFLFFALLGWMSLSLGSLDAVSSTAKPIAPSAANVSNSLTPGELQFSNQLSPYHKEVFMTVFTPQMRQEAVTMMEEYQEDMEDEMPMSADMCVEQTLMNHRAPPIAPTKSSKKNTP